MPGVGRRYPLGRTTMPYLGPIYCQWGQSEMKMHPSVGRTGERVHPPQTLQYLGCHRSVRRHLEAEVVNHEVVGFG